tara:strand:+ start:987 stop:1304 length:318 start_codon:yes stop_codon:yes gene_type:complete
MRVNYKYDIANASKEKHEKWAKLERMNIQNKVDDIKSRAKEIGELSDWDIEAIAKVEKVLQDENRKQFERDIGEILKLAGLHSEFEKRAFYKKQANARKRKDDEQ